MTNENTAQATLNAWQAQLQQVRQRRLDRGGGHAGLAHLHQAQGKTGLRQVANLCLQKAHYAQKAICALPGYEPVFSGPFFKEFVVRCPDDPVAINQRLLDAGILGGLPLAPYHPDLGDAMLLCVTEQRSKEEIDALVAALRG